MLLRLQTCSSRLWKSTFLVPKPNHLTVLKDIVNDVLLVLLDQRGASSIMSPSTSLSMSLFLLSLPSLPPLSPSRSIHVSVTTSSQSKSILKLLYRVPRLRGYGATAQCLSTHRHFSPSPPLPPSLLTRFVLLFLLICCFCLPVLRDDDLVLHGGSDVTTVGSSKVDSHRACLHPRNHLRRHQLGGLFSTTKQAGQTWRTVSIRNMELGQANVIYF